MASMDEMTPKASTGLYVLDSVDDLNQSQINQIINHLGGIGNIIKIFTTHPKIQSNIKESNVNFDAIEQIINQNKTKSVTTATVTTFNIQSNSNHTTNIKNNKHIIKSNTDASLLTLSSTPS